MCKHLVNTYPHLLNVKDNVGRTALHNAAFAGNIELFNFLLGKGFSIETKRSDGTTVLHHSCMNGKLDMCKHLVNTYPHLLNVKDSVGGTALHDAALRGNIELFNFLLGKGFSIETKRSDGKTVLQLCCMKGKLDMCKYLTNTNPHLLDVKDNDGGTALHDAAFGGNIELFNFLLGKGLSIETKRGDGKTVLHQCCVNGKLDMCKYLVNTYPHLLDVKDNYGENALHDAARESKIDLVTFLSGKGLKETRKKSNLKTVRNLCCMS
ncbi:putative ankyrin repeat protein RF_0381 [Saccostrea echinata]|uniref:putative ankyrin repeat protein RF_0381 n=1 Tax=Saccostrea echinata TaxID=191078 RepID=UPI002A7FD014|nr:putative ankyrin repeat protein RF_0381 [Saccostrea echinata]